MNDVEYVVSIALPNGLAAHWHHVADVCVVLRSVPTIGNASQARTRPNGRRRGAPAGYPPFVGPRSRSECAIPRACRRQQKESLFCLSGFFANDKHGNQLGPFLGLSGFRRRLWQDG